MKKKTYIAIYTTIAALVIGTTGYELYRGSGSRASESSEMAGNKAGYEGAASDDSLDKDKYASSNVQTIEGTTTDMLDPQFWIGDKKEEVLYTFDEIEYYNRNNPNFVEYYSEEESRNLKLFMYDMPDTLSCDVVRSLIGEDVEAVIETDIENDVKNDLENDMEADVSDAAKYEYAICVKRSVARTLPSDEFVSDDPDEIFFDDLISAEVMPFTGVVILAGSQDGEWKYIINGSYGGWVKADTLAVCKDKEEWLSICQPDVFLIVTGSEIVMDETAVPTSSSGMILPMGTKIRLSEDTNCDNAEEDIAASSDSGLEANTAADNEETINGRSTIGAYTVDIPYREDDGSVGIEKTLIPVSKDVSVGYLNMTSESVLRQAFKFLGRVYGYGGSLSSNDCSGFIRQVYSCYGFDLPRNATAIAQRSDLGSTETSNMTTDKKKNILSETSPGMLLYMDGHIMMYLGMHEGEPYVISSCATCIEPGHDVSDIKDTFCVMVSGLDLIRTNGRTWLEDISYILRKGY